MNEKYPLFLLDFLKLEFSRHIFEKYSNIRFHWNLSSGSRVVSCGRTDRRTDITKLIVAFRNFANAPIEECINVNRQEVRWIRFALGEVIAY
jgi:hypothetical protein